MQGCSANSPGDWWPRRWPLGGAAGSPPALLFPLPLLTTAFPLGLGFPGLPPARPEHGQGTSALGPFLWDPGLLHEQLWLNNCPPAPPAISRTLPCSLRHLLPKSLPCPSPSVVLDLHYGLKVLPPFSGSLPVFFTSVFPPQNLSQSNSILVTASQRAPD